MVGLMSLKELPALKWACWFRFGSCHPPLKGLHQQHLFRLLFELFNDLTDLPLSKKKAIQILVDNPDDPDEPLFRVNKGLDPAYNAPWFKVHW